MYSWLEKTNLYPNQKLVPLAEKNIFSLINIKNRNQEPPSMNLCFQGSPLFSQKDFFPSQFNWPEKTQEWEKLTTLFQISKKKQRIKKFFKKGQFPTKTIGNPRIYLKPWLSSQQWLEERSSLQVRKKRGRQRSSS